MPWQRSLEKISGVKIPKAIEEIRTAPVRHNTVAEAADMPQVVKKILKNPVTEAHNGADRY